MISDISDIVIPLPRAMDRVLQQNDNYTLSMYTGCLHIGDLNLDLQLYLPHFYPYTTDD